MHAVALHVGAGVLPHGERFRIIAKNDAGLFEHRVCILLDEGEALLVEHLVDLDRALDVGLLDARTAAGARRAAGRSTAARSPSAPCGRGFLIGYGILAHRSLPWMDKGAP
jgi:hypothetical protein